MDLWRCGKGVEGNSGIYRRVQRLKEMLKEYHDKQLTDQEKEQIKNSNDQKILVVTHSRVLQSFSATGIDTDGIVQNEHERIMGKGLLVGATYF